MCVWCGFWPGLDTVVSYTNWVLKTMFESSARALRLKRWAISPAPNLHFNANKGDDFGKHGLQAAYYLRFLNHRVLWTVLLSTHAPQPASQTATVSTQHQNTGGGKPTWTRSAAERRDPLTAAQESGPGEHPSACSAHAVEEPRGSGHGRRKSRLFLPRCLWRLALPAVSQLKVVSRSPWLAACESLWKWVGPGSISALPPFLLICC